MLIQQCVTSKPGLFENRTLEFGDGITVIHGRNNSGKSLLARAMIDVLTLCPFDQRLLPAKIWENLHLDLVSVNGSGRFRYINNGDKNITIRARDDRPEEDIYFRSLAEHRLEDSLSGISSRPGGIALADFYRRISPGLFCAASIVPSPVDVPKNTLFRISDLRGLFTDDGSGFYETCLAAVRDFGAEGSGAADAAADGEIARGRALLKELEKNIRINEIQHSKYEKLFVEKQSVEDEIERLKIESVELKRKKEVLQKILENLDVRDLLDERIAALNGSIRAEESKDREIRQLRERMQTLFPQFENFSDRQKQNLKRIQEVYRELRDVREQIDNYNSSVEQKKRNIRNVVLALTIASGLAAILSWSNFIITIGPAHRFRLLISLAGMIAAGALAFFGYGIAAARSSAFIRLNEQKSSIEKTLQDLLRENHVDENDYRIEALYEFLLQYFVEYSEYTDLQMEIMRLESQLLGPERVEELKRDLAEVKADRKRHNRELDANVYSLNVGDSIVLDGEGVRAYLAKIHGDIESLNRTLEARMSNLAQLETEIQRTRFDGQERERMIADRDRAAAALDGLEKRKAAARYVAGLLEETVARREERQREKLIKSALGRFHALTENQYITEIDEAQFRGLIAGSGEYDLNPGLAHLILLSIKLALTDFLIDRKIPIPLIIDDPFLFMDDVRAGRFKSQLDDIARTRQVLIFTHTAAFKDWGTFIEL